MTLVASLIPELENISSGADPKRRSRAVRQIADLFLAHSDHFTTDSTAIFDQILGQLVPRTEIATRAHVAARLGPLANAPALTIKRLARDDEISVSGPVLSASPLIEDEMLIDIARMKGQQHLSAIAARPKINEGVTDVILRRGDRAVVRTVAGNQGAAFSKDGYSSLVKRAREDGVLAIAVGQRRDISEPHLKQLVNESVDLVRRRLISSAEPARRTQISNVIAEVAGLPDPAKETRDYKAAQRAILALHRTGDLNEVSLAAMAIARNYEETIAALSAMSGVPIESMERLVLGERLDPILIVSRGLGFEWETARAIILLRRSSDKAPSNPDLEIARNNFEHLSPSTAQRVMRFWQLRRNGQSGW